MDVRRAVIGKIAVGLMAVSVCGGMAGMGLANYTESGSFHFYKQARMPEWRPEPEYVAAVQTSDLAASASAASFEDAVETR